MSVKRHPSPWLVTALAAVLLGGCGPSDSELRLGVTTSTRDSGLLDIITADFESVTGVGVAVIAAGTGHILALGETGDVDVMLVHSPAAEQRFVESGYTDRREPVMTSRFLLVGPVADPAGVSGATPRGALHRIRETGQRFVSRGDSSGTHVRELELWGEAPTWDGYVETGRGQGATLVTADQLSAYTLADHATYLQFRDRVDLVVITENFPELVNPYSVLVVSSRAHPDVQGNLGNRFADYLLSEAGRRVIDQFTIRGETPFRTAPASAATH